MMTLRTSAVMFLTSAVVAAVGGCQRPIGSIRTEGDLLFDQGEYADAADAYTQIADRYPGDWEGQYRLGLCRLELGEVSAARRALEIAHSRRPSDSNIADALAEAMYQEGDEAGLFAFLRERAESTKSVEAYRRLARFCIELSDPDSARVALETAIRLDGARSVEPYLDAAGFAERLGDIDQALRRLRQAYGIDPRDQRVQQRLRALGEVPGPTIMLPPG